MRFRCPKCGVSVEASSLASGERVLCTNCRARLKLPPSTDPPLPLPGGAGSLVEQSPTASEPSDPLPSTVNYPSLPIPPQPGTSVFPSGSAAAPWTQPGYPPMFPVAVPTAPPEFLKEQMTDLRDQRFDRRLRRKFLSEDRFNESVGLQGFGLAITGLVLAMSGWLFSKNLIFYAWAASAASFMLALTSLPKSIAGVFQIGRPRLFGGLGLLIASLLLLLIVPSLMISLSNK